MSVIILKKKKVILQVSAYFIFTWLYMKWPFRDFTWEQHAAGKTEVMLASSKICDIVSL